jgi:hypothetical protein
MERIPERELMTDREQVIAYGRADFEEPHSNFIKMLQIFCPAPESIITILDMGCGAGGYNPETDGGFPERRNRGYRRLLGDSRVCPGTNQGT